MDIEVKNGFVEIYEENDDAYFPELVDKIRITSITASYSEDRENLIGICRMDTLEIFYDKDFDYENDVWTIIWNELCTLEYNTLDAEIDDDEENPYDWRNEAIRDIANFTGVDKSCIDICD